MYSGNGRSGRQRRPESRADRRLLQSEHSALRSAPARWIPDSLSVRARSHAAAGTAPPRFSGQAGSSERDHCVGRSCRPSRSRTAASARRRSSSRAVGSINAAGGSRCRGRAEMRSRTARDAVARLTRTQQRQPGNPGSRRVLVPPVQARPPRGLAKSALGRAIRVESRSSVEAARSASETRSGSRLQPSTTHHTRNRPARG